MGGRKGTMKEEAGSWMSRDPIFEGVTAAAAPREAISLI
jgi:hypothetical protein